MEWEIGKKEIHPRNDDAKPFHILDLFPSFRLDHESEESGKF
ncbi:unnamed protein product, partial [marine sediment metagenome]